MSDSQRLDAEKLVEIHKARDEWEGNLLIGYLRDNGVEATFQGDPAVNLDVAHMLKSTDDAFGVFVLEENAAKGRELVREFVTTATDQAVLEEDAAEKLHVSKEQITQLRGALLEERQTFGFLGWMGLVFLGSAALVWLAGPALELPQMVRHWTMVVLLALGAVCAGRWASRKL
jgi:hypothetical protein